jgi:single-stranded DNA-binding protein
MTSLIYISGKLSVDPSFSETAKQKTMCRFLLECSLTREVKRNEFQNEEHLLPFVAFSWVAEILRGLKAGDRIMVGARVCGTKYQPPGAEPRYGVQLVCDSIHVSPLRNSTVMNS